MRVTTDDLGVVAFVLPGAPHRTFELHEWPDGSFSLEPVAGSAGPALMPAARARVVHPSDVDVREARTA